MHCLAHKCPTAPQPWLPFKPKLPKWPRPLPQRPRPPQQHQLTWPLLPRRDIIPMPDQEVFRTWVPLACLSLPRLPCLPTWPHITDLGPSTPTYRWCFQCLKNNSINLLFWTVLLIHTSVVCMLCNMPENIHSVYIIKHKLECISQIKEQQQTTKRKSRG
jgi:hypothetical protein